jgi:hypothetical protein
MEVNIFLFSIIFNQMATCLLLIMILIVQYDRTEYIINYYFYPN